MNSENIKLYNFNKLKDCADEFNPDDVKLISVNDEPQWELNLKLKEFILNGMPDNLSNNEKALYLYYKMCIAFSYDEGYQYKDYLSRHSYTSTFNKGLLESLVPGDKLTCYEFSRVYVNAVRELFPDSLIDAKITSQRSGFGHYNLRVVTDESIFFLEAINLRMDERRNIIIDSTNDLAKAKSGIKLTGVKPLIGVKGVEKTLDGMSRYFNGIDHSTIEEFSEDIKRYGFNLGDIESNGMDSNELEYRIKAFLEVAKFYGLRGNELVQMLNCFKRNNFFGQGLEIGYVGKPDVDKSRHTFRRYLLLRASVNQDEDLNNSPIFIIDSNNANYRTISKDEIITDLKQRKYFYEDKNHMLRGVEYGKDFD